MKNIFFEIDMKKYPNVLFLGNGILRLGEKSSSWGVLINNIKMREGKINISDIPYAMQPEAVCGVDVEEIQRRVANNISTAQETNPILANLLSLPFDAILTTNYTYEIESVLSGKPFTRNARKAAFFALDGNTKVNHNTFVCNVVRKTDGSIIPVFHVHGEAERKHSLVLSYYSYAKSVSLLQQYNRDKLGNNLYQKQIQDERHLCRCWLDYFIMGNVWSVGLGLDVSEFDIWWAIERKARENASHGKFKAYLDRMVEEKPQAVLLDAMDMEYEIYPVSNGNFLEMYQKAYADIQQEII
ncbi:hypothetical protein [Butyrivibrio sp. WCD2001]|uniref:hypothetical protein n=1 Tax=Butyrivibrio sp. WCD2001 TaxID=1280681 RepID=UPI00041BC040|nr:hypothetical protein [Butyrivibrio sp. WCD2001]